MSYPSNPSRLTHKQQAEIERQWDLRREAVRLVKLVAAEFRSDPMSVQCFDARIVKRVIECAAESKDPDEMGVY